MLAVEDTMAIEIEQTEYIQEDVKQKTEQKIAVNVILDGDSKRKQC